MRSYQPYGTPRHNDDHDTDRGWIGQIEDTTGLNYLNARYYDPSTGVFIAPDPLADATNLKTLNPYSYSTNNPTTDTDPSGLSVDEGGQRGRRYNANFNQGRGGWDTGPSLEEIDETKNRVDEYLSDPRRQEQFLLEVQRLIDSCAVFGFGHGGCGVYTQGHTREQADAIFWLAYGLIADGFRQDLLVWDNSKGGGFTTRECKETGSCIGTGSRAGYLLVGVPDEAKDWTMVLLAELAEGPLGFSSAGSGVGGVGRIRQAVGLACSFAADTPVLMADGTAKPISQVEVGDEVLSTDPETGETGPRRVLATLPHTDQLLTLDTTSGQIVTTEDHHYWNNGDGEWQESQDLDPGDRLLTADGDEVLVEGFDWSTVHAAPAYDLDVADLDTFYVAVGDESVLVHNSNCPWQLKLDANTNNLILDGPLPAGSDLAKLDPGQLRGLESDIQTSLANRRINLYDPQFENAPMGEFLRHAQRITDEENLLSRVQKLLEN